MSEPPTKRIVSAIVLAAGSSQRFGATKLAQTLRGKPLLQHALLAARQACPGLVTLVVGHDRDTVVAAAADLSDSVVFNDRHRNGIGSSIAAGVRASRGSSDAILVLLADQPRISAAHLNGIIGTWSGADNEIVASSFDGVRGPPILFPPAAFDALETLDDDRGAKRLLTGDRFVVRSVEYPPAGFDVDTPDDLRRLDQR